MARENYRTKSFADADTNGFALSPTLPTPESLSMINFSLTNSI
jgi:hypothetical protein